MDRCVPLQNQGQVFRGVVEAIETAERLVDAGCITKSDLVGAGLHRADAL
jgi:hypothetical protein